MADVVREILLCLFFSALLGVAIGWLARGLRVRRLVSAAAAESRRALKAARADLHASELALTEEQRSRSELQAAAGSARDEVEKLRGELRATALARDAARHDTNGTREQLLKLADELKSAEAARLAAEQDLDSLQAATAKVRARAEEAERERDALQGQRAPNQAADATRQHLDTLRATLQAAEGGWDAARAQAAAAQQELAATRRQLAESEVDRQALAARLVEAQVVLAELRARLDPPPASEAPGTRKGSPSLPSSDGASAPKSRPKPLRDDLQQIHGIGPVLERTLHRRGIYRYAQIASWTPEDILAISKRSPGFHERIVRDEWAAAARKLHIAKYGSPP